MGQLFGKPAQHLGNALLHVVRSQLGKRRLDVPLARRLRDGLEQRLFGRVVPVNGGFGAADAANDLGHGCALKPELQENLRGDFQNRLAARFRANFHAVLL